MIVLPQRPSPDEREKGGDSQLEGAQTRVDDHGVLARSKHVESNDHQQAEKAEPGDNEDGQTEEVTGLRITMLAEHRGAPQRRRSAYADSHPAGAAESGGGMCKDALGVLDFQRAPGQGDQREVGARRRGACVSGRPADVKVGWWLKS